MDHIIIAGKRSIPEIITVLIITNSMRVKDLFQKLQCVVVRLFRSWHVQTFLCLLFSVVQRSWLGCFIAILVCVEADYTITSVEADYTKQKEDSSDKNENWLEIYIGKRIRTSTVGESDWVSPNTSIQSVSTIAAIGQPNPGLIGEPHHDSPVVMRKWNHDGEVPPNMEVLPISFLQVEVERFDEASGHPFENLRRGGDTRYHIEGESFIQLERKSCDSCADNGSNKKSEYHRHNGPETQLFGTGGSSTDDESDSTFRNDESAEEQRLVREIHAAEQERKSKKRLIEESRQALAKLKGPLKDGKSKGVSSVTELESIIAKSENELAETGAKITKLQVELATAFLAEDDPVEDALTSTARDDSSAKDPAANVFEKLLQQWDLLYTRLHREERSLNRKLNAIMKFDNHIRDMQNEIFEMERIDDDQDDYLDPDNMILRKNKEKLKIKNEKLNSLKATKIALEKRILSSDSSPDVGENSAPDVGKNSAPNVGELQRVRSLNLKIRNLDSVIKLVSHDQDSGQDSGAKKTINSIRRFHDTPYDTPYTKRLEERIEKILSGSGAEPGSGSMSRWKKWKAGYRLIGRLREHEATAKMLFRKATDGADEDDDHDNHDNHITTESDDENKQNKTAGYTEHSKASKNGTLKSEQLEEQSSEQTGYSARANSSQGTVFSSHNASRDTNSTEKILASKKREEMEERSIQRIEAMQNLWEDLEDLGRSREELPMIVDDFTSTQPELVATLVAPGVLSDLEVSSIYSILDDLFMDYYSHLQEIQEEFEIEDNLAQRLVVKLSDLREKVSEALYLRKRTEEMQWLNEEMAKQRERPKDSVDIIAFKQQSTNELKRFERYFVLEAQIHSATSLDALDNLTSEQLDHQAENDDAVVLNNSVTAAIIREKIETKRREIGTLVNQRRKELGMEKLIAKTRNKLNEFARKQLDKDPDGPTWEQRQLQLEQQMSITESTLPDLEDSIRSVQNLDDIGLLHANIDQLLTIGRSPQIIMLTEVPPPRSAEDSSSMGIGIDDSQDTNTSNGDAVSKSTTLKVKTHRSNLVARLKDLQILVIEKENRSLREQLGGDVGIFQEYELHDDYYDRENDNDFVDDNSDRKKARKAAHEKQLLAHAELVEMAALRIRQEVENQVADVKGKMADADATFKEKIHAIEDSLEKTHLSGGVEILKLNYLRETLQQLMRTTGQEQEQEDQADQNQSEQTSSQKEKCSQLLARVEKNASHAEETKAQRLLAIQAQQEADEKLLEAIEKKIGTISKEFGDQYSPREELLGADTLRGMDGSRFANLYLSIAEMTVRLEGTVHQKNEKSLEQNIDDYIRDYGVSEMEDENPKGVANAAVELLPKIQTWKRQMDSILNVRQTQNNKICTHLQDRFTKMKIAYTRIQRELGMTWRNLNKQLQKEESEASENDWNAGENVDREAEANPEKFPENTHWDNGVSWFYLNNGGSKEPKTGKGVFAKLLNFLSNLLESIGLVSRSSTATKSSDGIGLGGNSSTDETGASSFLTSSRGGSSSFLSSQIVSGISMLDSMLDSMFDSAYEEDSTIPSLRGSSSSSLEVLRGTTSTGSSTTADSSIAEITDPANEPLGFDSLFGTTTPEQTRDEQRSPLAQVFLLVQRFNQFSLKLNGFRFRCDEWSKFEQRLLIPDSTKTDSTEENGFTQDSDDGSAESIINEPLPAFSALMSKTGNSIVWKDVARKDLLEEMIPEAARMCEVEDDSVKLVSGGKYGRYTLVSARDDMLELISALRNLLMIDRIRDESVHRSNESIPNGVVLNPKDDSSSASKDSSDSVSDGSASGSKVSGSTYGYKEFVKEHPEYDLDKLDYLIESTLRTFGAASNNSSVETLSQKGMSLKTETGLKNEIDFWAREKPEKFPSILDPLLERAQSISAKCIHSNKLLFVNNIKTIVIPEFTKLKDKMATADKMMTVANTADKANASSDSKPAQKLSDLAVLLRGNLSKATTSFVSFTSSIFSAIKGLSSMVFSRTTMPSSTTNRTAFLSVRSKTTKEEMKQNKGISSVRSADSDHQELLEGQQKASEDIHKNTAIITVSSRSIASAHRILALIEKIENALSGAGAEEILVYNGQSISQVMADQMLEKSNGEVVDVTDYGNEDMIGVSQPAYGDSETTEAFGLSSSPSSSRRASSEKHKDLLFAETDLLVFSKLSDILAILNDDASTLLDKSSRDVELEITQATLALNNTNVKILQAERDLQNKLVNANYNDVGEMDEGSKNKKSKQDSNYDRLEKQVDEFYAMFAKFHQESAFANSHSSFMQDPVVDRQQKTLEIIVSSPKSLSKPRSFSELYPHHISAKKKKNTKKTLAEIQGMFEQTETLMQQREQHHRELDETFDAQIAFFKQNAEILSNTAIDLGVAETRIQFILKMLKKAVRKRKRWASNKGVITSDSDSGDTDSDHHDSDHTDSVPDNHIKLDYDSDSEYVDVDFRNRPSQEEEIDSHKDISNLSESSQEENAPKRNRRKEAALKAREGRTTQARGQARGIHLKNSSTLLHSQHTGLSSSKKVGSPSENVPSSGDSQRENTTLEDFTIRDLKSHIGSFQEIFNVLHKELSFVAEEGNALKQRASKIIDEQETFLVKKLKTAQSSLHQLLALKTGPESIPKKFGPGGELQRKLHVAINSRNKLDNRLYQLWIEVVQPTVSLKDEKTLDVSKDSVDDGQNQPITTNSIPTTEKTVLNRFQSTSTTDSIDHDSLNPDSNRDSFQPKSFLASSESYLTATTQLKPATEPINRVDQWDHAVEDPSNPLLLNSDDEQRDRDEQMHKSFLEWRNSVLADSSRDEQMYKSFLEMHVDSDNKVGGEENPDSDLNEFAKKQEEISALGSRLLQARKEVQNVEEEIRVLRREYYGLKRKIPNLGKEIKQYHFILRKYFQKRIDSEKAYIERLEAKKIREFDEVKGIRPSLLEVKDERDKYQNSSSKKFKEHRDSLQDAAQFFDRNMNGKLSMHTIQENGPHHGRTTNAAATEHHNPTTSLVNADPNAAGGRHNHSCGETHATSCGHHNTSSSGRTKSKHTYHYDTHHDGALAVQDRPPDDVPLQSIESIVSISFDAADIERYGSNIGLVIAHQFLRIGQIDLEKLVLRSKEHDKNWEEFLKSTYLDTEGLLNDP